MKTELPIEFTRTHSGATAERVLRSCVHCGMCNATCPTYQLTGDELDGPRGRIYLIKQALEGQPISGITQQHLDRCLGCRACETTCPSGVEYHKLYEIGREVLKQRTRRSWWGSLDAVGHSHHRAFSGTPAFCDGCSAAVPCRTAFEMAGAARRSARGKSRRSLTCSPNASSDRMCAIRGRR